MGKLFNLRQKLYGHLETHLSIQQKIHETNSVEKDSCFGGNGILTKEEFTKSCTTAEKMSKLGRW